MHLSHLPTIQVKYKEESKVVATAASSGEALGKHLHGLHFAATRRTRVQHNICGGRPFFEVRDVCADEATIQSKATDVAKLFFKHVVKYWGLPLNIVSDRDTRLTEKFWPALFKLIKTQLLTSLGFHPRTDEQTKRVNAGLEIYLRHFVHADQKNWPELLDATQFSYNMQTSSSIG